MPDVPKGSFYLGDKLGDDRKRAHTPVFYDAANLTTHGVIVESLLDQFSNVVVGNAGCQRWITKDEHD